MYVKGGCLSVVIIHNAPHNADIKCASEPFADCGRCQDRLHSEDQARHHEHHGKVSLLNNRCDICRKQRLYKVSSKPASTKVDYHYNFRITKAKLSYLGTKFTRYLWVNFWNNCQKICLCKRFDKYHVCLSSGSRNTISYFFNHFKFASPCRPRYVSNGKLFHFWVNTFFIDQHRSTHL